MHIVTIYVELLDEGTQVWRPAEARVLDGERFELLGPVPEEEMWLFPAGTIVKCREVDLSEGRCLVAFESVSAES